jgi:peroxiredoxin
MTIAVGDKIASSTLAYVSEDGPAKITTDQLFDGKRVVLFGLPGAFTGNCSTKHVPGYLNNYDALMEAGADTIAVVAVNDIFVMQAWQKSTGADTIVHLADWNAAFVKAAGLDIDLSAGTLGIRSKRFAMIIDDGVVTSIEIERSPGDVIVSSAENILSHLKEMNENNEAA